MSLLWKKFPNTKPKKEGWYQCTISFEFDRTIFGESVYQTYVMDLYWKPETQRFVDNRRQNVFDSFEVFTDSTLKEKIHTDSLFDRTDEVTAWKKVSRPYKDPHKLYLDAQYQYPEKHNLPQEV